MHWVVVCWLADRSHARDRRSRCQYGDAAARARGVRSIRDLSCYPRIVFSPQMARIHMRAVRHRLADVQKVGIPLYVYLLLFEHRASLPFSTLALLSLPTTTPRFVLVLGLGLGLGLQS